MRPELLATLDQRATDGAAIYVSPKTACRMLDIGEQTLRYAYTKGTLRVSRFSATPDSKQKAVRIKVSDLLAWAESLATPEPEAPEPKELKAPKAPRKASA